MHIDELTRALQGAAAAEPPADATAGRDAVARRVHRHQTRRVAAIAVCVLVLLGAFAITISRVGTRDPGYATSTQGIPKLVPSDLPDGLRIKDLVDHPDEASAVPVVDVHVSVFAKPGAAPPADAVTIAKVRIGSTETPGSRPPPGATFDPVTVETDADGGRSTGRMEPDGSTIVVTSPTVDASTLTEIARSVRFLPGGEVEPSSVPSTFERVVSNVRTFWFGASLIASRGTSGYVQLYATSPAATPTTTPRLGALWNADKSLSLSVLAAAPGDLAAARWAVPHAQSRTVRGHPGVSGFHQIATASSRNLSTGSGSLSGDSRGTPTVGTVVPDPSSPPDPDVSRSVIGTYSVLLWMENDSTLVQLWSSGYSVDELARIAEGLRVDPTDFRDLRAATTTTSLDERCRRTEGGGTICQTQGSSGGAGSCRIEPPATGPAGAPDTDGRPGVIHTCQATAVEDGNGPTTVVPAPPTAPTSGP